MPKITKLTDTLDGEKVNVFIDGQYCTSIRKRTWKAIDLAVGSNISCEDLKIKENFFWKKAYGQKSWEAEKRRLERVEGWLNKYLPDIQIERDGFGADTIELIEQHPDESGAPDLSLKHKEQEIIALEVTGTEILRGNDYWVRPDKVNYAHNHPERDVWIVLHYQEPSERFIWLKPITGKEYVYDEIEIRGVVEHYIIFNDGDEEIKSSDKFREYILNKIQYIFPIYSE